MRGRWPGPKAESLQWKDDMRGTSVLSVDERLYACRAQRVESLERGLVTPIRAMQNPKDIIGTIRRSPIESLDTKPRYTRNSQGGQINNIDGYNCLFGDKPLSINVLLPASMALFEQYRNKHPCHRRALDEGLEAPDGAQGEIFDDDRRVEEAERVFSSDFGSM
ncbi:uncharacterized protein BT62DRAFT_921223 [Guyanagaster necrorhizus]|uniref:Uncharacterized protein n=1 Tax=Guyanagaster necrorhizus TaxID=856835 RepID=A0A9P8AQV5_9AGAR|nr:uncharacterized protein BT62DRAFT_921223 [Guyanagaster necrorhizus MCA 3950]KAG7444410.1 hypothetical protein BT62DRAFT_921223 [Guyanagaster necrorhizus MCA 3950]